MRWVSRLIFYNRVNPRHLTVHQIRQASSSLLSFLPARPKYNEGWPGILMTGPFFLLSFVFYLSLSCTLVDEEAPLFNNPLDPDDDNFIPVETYITAGPEDGETVTDHVVTFSWSGNDGVTEYSYSLNGSEWSDYSPETSTTFSYLDDSEYVFEVKGQYHEQAEDESPATRSFTVDAVKGPALMFGPRMTTVSRSSNFTVDLMAEEVSDLMAVYAEIQYDKVALRFDGYQVITGAILESNGGSVADIIEEDADNGIIKINLVVVGGSSSGVNGSGPLIQLQFRSLSKTGLSNLVLKNTSALIGSNLSDITINELVDGMVEVVE